MMHDSWAEAFDRVMDMEGVEFAVETIQNRLIWTLVWGTRYEEHRMGCTLSEFCEAIDDIPEERT